MRTYRYSGIDAKGSRKSGVLEAESEKEALRNLSAQGIFAEKIAPLRGNPSSRGMPETKRSVFYRGLSALLQAGLPLDHALELLMGESGEMQTDEAIAPIRDAVCEGASFASAVAESEPNLSRYERAMLEAAERTGALPEMLARIASFQESRRAMTEKLRSAMAYPSFVLVLGVLVAFLMLGVLVPLAQRSLASSGIALPRLSLIIVSGARIVAWAFGLALVGAFFAIVILKARCRRSPITRIWVGQRLLSIPYWGQALRALAAQRFSETLSALIRAGVPLVEGFSLAGAATGNAWVEQQASEQAEQIRNGTRVSEGISHMDALSAALREWVRVGEAGGCLDAMLDVAATRALSQWNHACDRVLALVGPIVLVSVGIFVLAVALAVLLPVTAMTLNVG